MPAIHAVPGRSYWLTVDTKKDGEPDYQGELNGIAYEISDDNIYIQAIDFNKKDLLAFAEFWLAEKGYTEVRLIEGDYEEFAGTNQHAANLTQAASAFKEFKNKTGDEDE